MACCLAIPCGNCSPNQVLQSTGVSWSRLQHTCGELVLGILPCACVEPTLTLEPVPAAASPSAPPARAPHFHAVGTAAACKVTASTSTTPGTLGGTTFPAKPCSSAAKCFQDKCCFQLIPLAPGAGLGWAGPVALPGADSWQGHIQSRMQELQPPTAQAGQEHLGMCPAVVFRSPWSH